MWARRGVWYLRSCTLQIVWSSLITDSRPQRRVLSVFCQGERRQNMSSHSWLSIICFGKLGNMAGEACCSPRSEPLPKLFQQLVPCTTQQGCSICGTCHGDFWAMATRPGDTCRSDSAAPWYSQWVVFGEKIPCTIRICFRKRKWHRNFLHDTFCRLEVDGHLCHFGSSATSNPFFCCGTMQHVAWRPHPRRGWYHCTLWCCGWCLASLLWSSGRPWPGRQAFGQHATIPGGSEHHGGAHGEWQAAHRIRGNPTGDDIPCLPPESTSFKGLIAGGLGGSRPMDYILDEHDYNYWIGKPHELNQLWEEVEVCPSDRPERRERILGGDGDQQGQVLLQVPGEGRWPASRFGRPIHRTNQCSDKEGGATQTTALLRLCSVCAVCQETLAGAEIPKLRPSRRRNISFEDGAGSGELRTLAGQLQSYENHLHHDGDHHAEQPHAMGEHDREDEQTIPIVLGIDSCSRRSGKRRIHGKDPSKNEDGFYPRRNTTNWVGRRTTLEPRMAEDSQGQGVLERPILRSSHDVDGKRFKGCTTHAHGRRSQCQLARWTTCTTRRDGGQPGDQRWGREENPQPSQKRSQETEDGSGKRRAQDVEERQWERRKGWRKQGWSKRQRWVWSTKRRRMLRVEQWEWLVWWPGSGRRLPGQGEAPPQVHNLQIARSPESRMPTGQEELNYILKFAIVTVGGARGDAKERKENKPVEIGGGRNSAPDRSGVRRNLDESKGTRRKRTTGDDPPGGDEDPPPGRIHVDGEFLTFEEYLERRVFNFVHHYCGEHDRLSEEVERECKKQGIRVNTTSIDLEKGHDLTQKEPYVHHLD